MDNIIVNSIEEMNNLGIRLGKLLKKGMVVTLQGDLAAGKTTFSKGIGIGLGVNQIINSPTYTIVKIYQGTIPFYHFDAYRLENQEIDLGFEELIYGDGVSVIEWPQFMEEILPTDKLEICITVDDDLRIFKFNPIGNEYFKLCKELLL